MKRTFLLIALLTSSILSFGQVIVGEVDINQIDDLEVIEVLVDNRSLIRSVDVMVDYGHLQNEVNAWGKRLESRITDPDTKERMVFKSSAHVINFLEKRGWKNYSVVTREGVFYYYFRWNKE
ncbi:hypothetical protein DSL64_26430 [Dyadobacter luteus]|uniref:Uncharacterized protein n=1 Tax=Dyadobacter luteus TaxID=2259619 RepID=A0A3D8Y3F3_9BACT|nr:hypothetical protein [Dyadobacter luteus]REA56553.1 hypothetical protein DSL64_26430 [Dyadobacter luteus]